MADTVKIPGIKQPLPKWAAFAGLGAVGVAIVLHFRNSSSQAATTAATTTGGLYPPDGTVGDPTDPYSTDPATGQTYGNEGLGSFGSTGGGVLAGGGGGDTGGGSGGPPFSSNDAWSNWVIQQIQTLNPTVNTSDLTDALGLYLAGQPVDPAQKTYVLDAEAIGGPPPVAGPGNYPPNVRTNGNKGGGGNAVNPVTGLKQTGQEGFTGADITWQPSPHATSYQVTSDKGSVSMTGATSARIHDIAPAHSQATVSVLAKPAAAGAVPAKIVVHVTGKAR